MFLEVKKFSNSNMQAMSGNIQVQLPDDVKRSV